MARSSMRAWLGFAVLCAAFLSACRVGPPVADALREPFPDAVADNGGAGGVSGDGGQPCDLLLQNCPDPKDACYPVDNQPGATMCSQPAGFAPPSTGCVSNLECDAREACVFVAESQLFMCATICDPSAVNTGCLPKAPCHLIPGYRAGFCVP